MNVTEAANLSHTDRCWILMALMLGSDWQFSTVHGDPWYKAWFKKMDSISYAYISWTIHGMWMLCNIWKRRS